MKTPEQIADEMFNTDISLGQDDKLVIVAAINADRAQHDCACALDAASNRES